MIAVERPVIGFGVENLLLLPDRAKFVDENVNRVSLEYLVDRIDKLFLGIGLEQPQSGSVAQDDVCHRVSRRSDRVPHLSVAHTQK